MEPVLLVLSVLGCVAILAAVAIRASGSPSQPPTRERKVRDIGGAPLVVERGHETRVRVDLQRVEGLPGEAARQAERRLKDSGAVITESDGELSVVWAMGHEVPDTLLDDLVTAAPLYRIVEEHREFEVNRSGLGLLGPLTRAEWADEIAALFRLDPASPGVRYELGHRGFNFTWRGDISLRSARLTHAHAIHRALEALSRDPWQVVDDLLASGSVDERARLYTVAQAHPALRGRVVPALLVDPDPELAWKVASAHGRPEHQVAVALRPGTSRDLQRRVLVALRDAPAADRCRAAAALSVEPTLVAELCELIGDSVGPEAESAWAKLSTVVDQPAAIRQVVRGFSRTGTRRYLPALQALHDRVGPLRFQLRAEVAQVLAEIRTREGVETGELTLVDPAAEIGAVSLASSPPRKDP